MQIELPKALEKDLYDFCILNHIEDVNSFIVTCFRNGYYIAKYGISPEDNFQSQNKPFKIKEIYEDDKDIGSEKEGKSEEKGDRGAEGNPSEEKVEQIEEVKKPVKRKKTIKVIKK